MSGKFSNVGTTPEALGAGMVSVEEDGVRLGVGVAEPSSNESR